MYKKGKVITFVDWQGVNNTQDPALIADNELQECVNLYVSNTGRLISRPGFTKVFDTPAKVLAISKFKNDLYVACDDGGVYKWDGTALNQIGTHDNLGDVYMQVAFEKLWIADGGKLKYYDGTNFGTIDDLIYFTENIGSGNGTTTSYSYTTKNIPVSPTSVSITYTVGGVLYTAVDDGRGSISGTNLTGTIAYDTGVISLTFSTVPDNATPIDIKYSISDVLDVVADFIEFRQERLWLAKGDSLYYSGIRDTAKWGFIKVGSKDESDISAIDQIYDRLVIFKEGKDRGIFALSGNSEADFAVSLITKGVSTKGRNKVSILGDLYFLDGVQLYSLKTVVEYGDIKPIQINQRFLIKDGSYSLIPVPVENVIFAFARFSGFAYNPNRNAFTSLATQEEITTAEVIENQIYLGGVNALFKMDNVILIMESLIFTLLKQK
ncbi:hypothetical protein [Hydrogenivirga sp. 128-5-R1-1]|uniref:hypothetical protein n=1 Tax=Hydrogenivirga sp. 128-5-R1-1 TaxID=392423 RepID=UPI00015EF707|nr:hypothetical protein [Hydrogenivirga sp. 128-5-R1-1]EDP74402.1 hypothetical protein HG1285_12887 [Hydrogenivirga sp. 128-5-R1-1]